jgi:hypothetical protein
MATMFVNIFAFAALGLAIAAAYTQDALDDMVVDLPGSDGMDLPFNHFSGYLDIEGKDGTLSKHMHYVSFHCLLQYPSTFLSVPSPSPALF